MEKIITTDFLNALMSRPMLGIRNFEGGH
jgi:hypothetical protein